MAVDFMLTVNGRDYGGWLRVRVERSVDQCCPQFGVISTRSWPGLEGQWDIQPGDEVTARLGEHRIVTGYIDQLSPGYDAEFHQIEIAGRGKTQDLVDCSHVGPPNQWKGTDGATIIRALVAPFGIELAIEADLGAPFADFKIQQGEKVWDAISRIARQRQVLAYERPDGTLLIARISEEFAETRLIQGENILRARATLSDKDRHSHYIVKGQQKGGNEVSPEQAAQSLGTIEDASIRRYRPLVFVNSAQTTNGTALDRATWERQHRWGEGRSADITLQGWLMSEDGAPWPINRLIYMDDVWLGLQREMAITGTTMELGARGTTTTLTIQPPEALTPEPYEEKVPKEAKGRRGGGGEGTDLWTQVGADRRAGEQRRLESKQ